MSLAAAVRKSLNARPFKVGRRLYHDKTLEWAKQNPEIAQECLQPPGWDLQDCDPSAVDRKTTSLEHYCEWRKWPHVSPTSDLSSMTVDIASHTLSAPLTLAQFHQNAQVSTTHRWCCVGARAEATLPYDFWKEFLLLTSTTRGGPVKVSMDFVGPDVFPKTPNQTVSLEDGSSMALCWPYRGLLHEMSDDIQWDAYVFLNPGFGHSNLQQGWQPTLERVVGEKKPLLLTAHSELDSRRDAEYLQKYGLQVEYTENIFASRITYQDPFDTTHIVRPNHYVAHVLEW